MSSRSLSCAVLLLLAGCRLAEALTPPTVLISGTVVDAAGRPVAGALLIANLPHQAGQPYVQTFGGRSRPDGTFEIRHHPEGGPLPTGHLAMSVSRDGLPPTEMLVPIPATMLKVVLGGAARVEVRAVAADGSPVEGPVVIQSTAPQKWAKGEAPRRRTDSQGQLTIDGVAPGEYVVLVSRLASKKVPMDANGDGQAAYVREKSEVDVARAAVTVAAGVAAVPVELQFAKSPLRLTGRVVDQTGAPVEGASVVGDGQVFARVAISDAKGAFVLEDMPEKQHVLMQAYKPGYQDNDRFSMKSHKAGGPEVVVVLTKRK